MKTLLATGETVSLAEWIIDDTCLVYANMMRKKDILKLRTSFYITVGTVLTESLSSMYAKYKVSE